MSRKMSKWEFIAWVAPFVAALPFVLEALGAGFIATVSVGIVLLIPVVWLAKKVVRPEDLK